MALIVVESDAAQADGRALSTTPFLPSCQPDGSLHAPWIPAECGDDGLEGVVSKWCIGGGVANTTTTYAYDSGNRQTSMTSMGVTTSNGYDDWGRLSTSARGGVTARYAWRYGSKLYSIDQDSNGTPEVTYKTGGDGKRRARITDASSTWYNWDSGFTVISEETGSTGTGALTRTYVGRSLAHVDGSNPATGTWRYMYHDHLGSVRQVRDANRNLVAEYAFLPYGQTDAWSGTANATTRLFTGHDRDPLTGQDYAPYRWYSSTMNRWLSKDPLGMVDGPNVYAYVRGNPVLLSDAFGLYGIGIVILPILGIGGYVASKYWCAYRIGMKWQEDAPGGSQFQHCMAACEIEKECGMGLGWLAAVLIETIQGDENPWAAKDDSEIRAGQIGAMIGEGCEDCDKGCARNYPDGVPWNWR